MKHNLDELKVIVDRFFNKCRDSIKESPWAVVIAMHEFYRNLYPNDPFIPLGDEACPTERIEVVVGKMIKFLDSSSLVGSYGIEIPKITENLNVKDFTGKVYGDLWRKFNNFNITVESVEILKERFDKNNIALSILNDKKAIDVGCGSGRYTYALKELGCASVLGIDYGEEGIGIAKEATNNIDGIDFQKASVLDIPYPDECFDFVFCNGVLHHTENMEKGIDEIVRITRKGGMIWLYLYGDGGIFWYARKIMPKIMKEIPQDYALKILELIGMPPQRFIFADNWYVPIERHCKDDEVRSILRKSNIKDIKRLMNGRNTDLEYQVFNGGVIGETMYGNGELRYLIKK
jgi:ubiquinone/menaquinone biosynthesis C-methylase UbiE